MCCVNSTVTSFVLTVAENFELKQERRSEAVSWYFHQTIKNYWRRSISHIRINYKIYFTTLKTISSIVENIPGYLYRTEKFTYLNNSRKGISSLTFRSSLKNSHLDKWMIIQKIGARYQNARIHWIRSSTSPGYRTLCRTCRRCPSASDTSFRITRGRAQIRLSLTLPRNAIRGSTIHRRTRCSAR